VHRWWQRQVLLLGDAPSLTPRHDFLELRQPRRPAFIAPSSRYCSRAEQLFHTGGLNCLQPTRVLHPAAGADQRASSHGQALH